jgi:serine/threonine-protein kinase
MASTPARNVPPARRGRHRIAWVAAGVLGAGAAALALVGATLFLRPTASAPLARLAIPLPHRMPVVMRDGQALELSRDGSLMTVATERNGRALVLLRRLSDDSMHVVAGSEGQRGGVAFSPDGRWLAFATEGRIFRVPVAGGARIAVLDHVEWGHIAWVARDAIVYARSYNSGLARVSPEGRDTVTLTKPDPARGELGHWWPQALPDGEHVLFTNFTTPADRSRIEVLSLKTGRRTVVQEGGYFARYTAGHLLFVRGTGVLAVPFDPDRLTTSGTPVPVLDDVLLNVTNGVAAFAVADDGTLAFVRGSSRLMTVALVDTTGREESLVDSAGNYSAAVLSPDGRRLAVVRDADVSVLDVARHRSVRLTRTEQLERSLLWTPDGRAVLYQRDVPQFDVFMRAADALTPESPVLTSATDKDPTSLSPDGRTLLYGTGPEADRDDVWATPLGASGPQGAGTRLLGGAGHQALAAFSHDGRWIAYESDESGRLEVYVVPYPLDRGPSREQVSVDGGTLARWAPDGRVLYFQAPDGRLLHASFDPATASAGRPTPATPVAGLERWNVAPDGRLLVVKRAELPTVELVDLVIGWASELRRLTGVRR